MKVSRKTDSAGGIPGKPVKAKLIFLFDVDNTLLDNDRVITDMRAYLQGKVGPTRAKHYWDIFERLRSKLGYADYLGALQRYRIEHPHDLHLLTISHFLVNYPFANRLYPNSLDALEHVGQWGPPVILTDGDVVFQPRKVDSSGLAEAVKDRVLIYMHKEMELADVRKRFPADHYVLVDDKLRILAAVKASWKSRVTTVFVEQGHYALDPGVLKKYPAADLSIKRIGDLCGIDLPRFLAPGKKKPSGG
ncbi:MAG: uncharacterized protein JWP91_1209 [Fibrobacteres bacterium]|nr:uncharacterized protein [Fibrobacterota bacterium]